MNRLFSRKRQLQPRISLKAYDKATATALNYLTDSEHWNEDNVAVIENDLAYVFVRVILESAGIRVPEGDAQ